MQSVLLCSNSRFGMTNNRKEFGKMQYRAGLGPFLNVYQQLGRKIQDEHRELLRETPFWGLFKAFDEELVGDAMCKKIYIDIIKIIRCFNAKTRSFSIGGKHEKFTPCDVEHLLGLPDLGRKIDISKRISKLKCGSYEFIIRNFRTPERVSRQDIEAAMLRVVEGTTNDEREDFVCLVSLHFCITLLFCNSGNTISWNLVLHCRNIITMKKYNWAKATSEFLERQLVKNGRKPGSVNGCVVALLFWVCEKLPLVAPIEDGMRLHANFVRWDLEKLHSEMKNVNIATVQIKYVPDPPCMKIEPAEGTSVKSNEVVSVKRLEDKFCTPITKKVRCGSVSDTVHQGNGDKKYKSTSIMKFQLGLEQKGVSPESTAKSGSVNSIIIPTQEFNPAKMFQLISSQDPIFQKGSEQSGQDRTHDSPAEPNTSLEYRVNGCLIQLERESSLNKALKGDNLSLDKMQQEYEKAKLENSKLKVRIEEAEVQAIEYNELFCDAEDCLREAYKKNIELVGDIEQIVEAIEGQKGQRANVSTPDIKTWIMRMKKRERKPKRLSGFIYNEEINKLREAKKPKLDKQCLKVGKATTVPCGIGLAARDGICSAIDPLRRTAIDPLRRPAIDPSSFSVWKYLSNDEQDRLHQFFTVADTGVPLWQGAYSAVYKEDLKEVLTGDAISCNIMDTYGEILQMELNRDKKLKTKSHIMHTNSWECLRRGDEKYISLFLHDPLLQVLATMDYIFFPMRHESSYHFSLLVMHKSDEEWFHYNPSGPSTNCSSDPCLAEAETLRDEVTAFLQFNSCIGSVVLERGQRVRQALKEGDKSTESPLTLGEKDTLKWLQTADPNYPLWPHASCPRQIPGSVDCGVVVLYYISTLSKGVSMVTKFGSNDMMRMRAEIISKYLSDEKSWKND